MAEAEQANRIASERSVIDANIQAQKEESKAVLRGHYLCAAVSMTSIAASVYSVSIGAHWSVSVALVGVPLMSAVRAIILRK